MKFPVFETKLQCYFVQVDIYDIDVFFHLSHKLTCYSKTEGYSEHNPNSGPGKGILLP